MKNFILLIFCLLFTCACAFKLGMEFAIQPARIVIIRNEPINVPIGSKVYASFDNKYFYKVDSITENSNGVTMPAFSKVLKIVRP